MSARQALFSASRSVCCCAGSSVEVSLVSARANTGRRCYSSIRKPWPSEDSGSKVASSNGRISGNSIIGDLPVPKSIAAYLDDYVIGQDHAKKALAVGVFNHYLRAATNRNGLDEDSQPALYGDRGKTRKLSRGKILEEEDTILSDFVGQTKGSRRWNEDEVHNSVEYVRKDGELEPGEAPSPSLSSTFFSSLRPGDIESQSDVKLNSQTERLIRSASKLITSPAVQLRRGRLDSSSRQMEKSNMIMIGPSGSGKSHLIRTLSTSLSVPFVHVDATPLTSAGYVGEDVESIMSRLLEAANWNVEEAERGIVCIDEVDKLASPTSSSSSGTIKTAGRDVGGTGVQQALLRLLEGSVVSIADKRNTTSPSSASVQAAMTARQNGTGRAGESKPWWSPEMQSLNAEHGGKVAQAIKRGNQSEALAEGKKKVGSTMASDGSGTVRIDTSKVLFVLCGAFVGLPEILAARGCTSLEDVEAEDLTAYGLIPEFVGRLPVIVTLNDLTEKDLCRILTEPKNALVSQYQTLFAAYKIKLHFTTPAIASLAHQAAQSSKTSSGARVLRRLMEKRLLDAMFVGPNGGARYALMDESAAKGFSQVQLFSRGGRSAWLNAIEEDEEKHKRTLIKEKVGSSYYKRSPQLPSTPSIAANPSTVKIRAHVRPGLSSSSSATSSSLLARIDEATLRRRARARLTRPSRVGNLRILTSEG